MINNLLKMKMTWIISFILFIQAFALPLPVLCSKPIDQKTFNQMLSDVDLDKKKKMLIPRQKSQSKKIENFKGFDNPFSTMAFQIFAYLLCITLFVFIIYSIFKNIDIVKNKKVLENQIDLEDIEDINKINLNQLYDQAIKANDYRLALRLKFLIIIQKLAFQNVVIWKKDKTNRAYINEIIQDQTRTDFRKIVSIYERVWYGNTALTEDLFQVVNKDFDTFNTKI
jgi:hypothetical protein